jgi:serine protease Do
MKTIKIGRNPDNDIILDDSSRTVSGYHAVLKVYDNGNITLNDNSTNGTYINGVKANKGIEVAVKKGDEVRFGPHFVLNWSLVDIPVAKHDATVIENGEEVSYTIGTESDNRIVISDPDNHVSRHHAILKLKRDGKYFIYDQSTNGIYVNGVKIKSKVDFPVSTTDSISLSNSYELDWNRIPNVSVPKAAPHVLNPPNEYRSNYSATTQNSTKIWSYLVSAAIFAGMIYFTYSKFNKPSKNQLKTQTAQLDSVVVSVQSDARMQPNTDIQTIVKIDISTLYERNKDAVFIIYTSDGTNNSQGSGFFISYSGVGISNYHVFKGTGRGLESIKTENGTFKVESVLASSDENDYIVFKVAGNGTTFPYLNIASSLPRVGEDVFAIGAPEGLKQTLSKGIVSALRTESDLTLIQTTTQITHGSSGGPLFNMRGEVIGITSGGLDAADLNFAVSIVGRGFDRY